MNLYLLSQSKNTNYDTYDSCVVVAASAVSARKMVPGHALADPALDLLTWAEPKHVSVQFLGKAGREFNKPRVICASFNAR